jgi:hypothetical protein
VVFASLDFDPAKSDNTENETKISAAAYAARINIQLVKATDLHGKMRERGIPKEITVQGVCRTAKNEQDDAISLPNFGKT